MQDTRSAKQSRNPTAPLPPPPPSDADRLLRGLPMESGEVLPRPRRSVH